MQINAISVRKATLISYHAIFSEFTSLALNRVIGYVMYIYIVSMTIKLVRIIKNNNTQFKNTG